MRTVESKVSESVGWSATTECAVADTEYELRLEPYTTQLQLRHESAAVAWRFSFVPGVVAGGGGFPVRADEVQTFDLRSAPSARGQTLYIAVATAGDVQAAGFMVLP